MVRAVGEAVLLGPAKLSSHSSYQLSRIKRFAEVVVSASFQAADSVHHSLTGCEDEHREVMFEPDVAQHLDSIAPRRLKVEHHQVKHFSLQGSASLGWI